MQNKSSPDMGRRLFLRGKMSARPFSVVRPPWALSEEKFLDSCTRCDDCITSCPEHIITRGDGGYPEAEFKSGECTFCGKCVESCDTGALHSPNSSYSSDDAWNLTVHFSSNCLSLNAIVCRACGDACDSQAIHFQLKLGGVAEPGVSQEDCTGCGACVKPCPVQAISMIQFHPVPEENLRESASV